MSNKEIIEKLLYKLKHEEFCEPNCYGCCGDGQLDITCKTVRENFEKELLKYYQPILPEGSVVLSNEEYSKLVGTIHRLQKYDEERDIALHARLKAETRKETAKEILKILQGYNYDGEIDELIKVIGKRYGVKVEE